MRSACNLSHNVFLRIASRICANHRLRLNNCPKYIDRIGYRIPTALAERIGKQQPKNGQHQCNSTNSNQSKKLRKRPIQRSLTPHFDCCPESYHNTTNKGKWRPIQCFVSLTDNLQPNTGGFEAVPGFHREFRSWVESGRKSMSTTPHRDGDEEQSEEQQQPHPQPCVGEYTHLNPTHDRELIRRIQHIPVKAGSVVFWDNRIPHGNSYRNDPPLADDDGGGETNSDYSKILGTSGSRAVVYCSFLPDVDINRIFVGKQLQYWKMKRSPRVGDRWIKQEDEGVDEKEGAFDAKGKQDGEVEKNEVQLQLTDLGQRLIGLRRILKNTMSDDTVACAAFAGSDTLFLIDNDTLFPKRSWLNANVKCMDSEQKCID
eukprot:scaffold1213_cov208-Alexandrium_tamarense.AAC.6